MHNAPAMGSNRNATSTSKGHYLRESGLPGRRPRGEIDAKGPTPTVEAFRAVGVSSAFLAREGRAWRHRWRWGAGGRSCTGRLPRCGRWLGRPRGGGAVGGAEPRGQAGRYLEGLLGPVERKNGWQRAEAIGDARPWRTRRVLSHVLWDEEAARDLCREHAVERLGAEDAVLVVDESAFVKKGEH